MKPSESIRLQKEIPNWQEKYWGAFSPETRRIVKLFLKGNLDGDDFWRLIYSDLGLQIQE